VAAQARRAALQSLDLQLVCSFQRRGTEDWDSSAIPPLLFALHQAAAAKQLQLQSFALSGSPIFCDIL
jgi:hypothetical protein